MEDNIQKIDFAVMSTEGDTPYSLIPNEAVKKIQEIAKDEDKWLFVDGRMQDVNTITTDDLIGEENIVLSAALVGGAENYAIVLNVDENFPYIGDTCVAITFKTEPDVIEVQLNKDRLPEIFAWRNELYKYIEAGLVQLTQDEYNEVMSDLNTGKMSLVAACVDKRRMEAKFAGSIKPHAHMLVGLNPANKKVKVTVDNENRYDILNARNHIVGAIKKQLEGTIQQNDADLRNALRI